MSPENVIRSEAIQLKRVLIATDFSDASHNALRYAVAIARVHGARLSIVHVVSSVGYRMVGADAEVLAVEHAARDLRELWDKLAANDESSRIELSLIVRQGEVSDELEDLIQKEQTNLLVLGTHGRAGFSKVTLGSVAEHVFRKASCPVLTVGPSSAPDWPQREVGAEKAILFGTDFGDASLQALPYAIFIANRNRSRLVFLHVAKFVHETKAVSITGHARDEIEQDLRQASMQRLKELIPIDVRLETELRVVFGPPSDGILGEAANAAAGIIVLGLHRKSLAVPPGHLPSSTAYQVVVRATCPVLTVRT
jgi:nucleotide-binding universal stress UspA family protein